MKRLLLCALIFPFVVNAQTNSVEVRDDAMLLLGSYNNISSAYGSIPSSVTNGYFIELTAAYNGSMEVLPIVLNTRLGVSETNSITIRPAAGVTMMTITGSVPGDAIIHLNDADYIHLDGRAGGSGPVALTIRNTGTSSGSNTIELTNGSCNNIISYCRIENSTTASAGRGIAFGASPSNPTGNSNNRVEYCTLVSGRYKINSTGTAANPNTHNVIKGCDISEVIFVGIWSQAGTGNLLVDSCSIHCTSASGDGPFGILFDGLSDTVTLINNRIYDLNNGSNSSAVKGISIRSTSTVSPCHAFIANNFIALSSSNPSSKPVVGIEYDGGLTASSKIVFNSVNIGGTLNSGGTAGNVASAAYHKTSSDSVSMHVIKNNIFVNSRTGGIAGAQHPAIAIEDTSQVRELNYNTYNSASGMIARWDVQTYTDLNLYKTARAPHETNSNEDTVYFVSNTDLHLTGSSDGNVNLAGEFMAEVPTDIDQTLRHAMFPYRGADEASALIISVNELSENSLLVYPNPARELLKIYGIQGAVIQLFDLTGRKLLSVNSETAETTIPLNVSAGTYLLHIQGKETFTRLIIVE